jgi:superfamily II DNA or RNA helicase
MPVIDSIIQEMTLREPQADSLTKFSQLLSGVDLRSMDQSRIKRLLQTGTLEFTEEYARLTFALATGVGKTRLMGAIAAYLFLENKSKHFVFLAPSRTILRKMKDEALVSHEKYLFKGLPGFPLPKVVHAENIESYNPTQTRIADSPTLFILTPGQIRPRSGGEEERRLRQPGEGFGDSFVDYLASLDDLVLFLDESHRYGQDARAPRSWAQAIVDLKPKLVIEMSATPSNLNTIVYRYDLKEALREGKYIKNVTAIVEQRQAAVLDEDWDKHALLEGYRRLHAKKSAIDAFVDNYPDKPRIKPVLLISAEDTTHSAWAEQWLLSEEFRNEVNAKILQTNPLTEKLSREQLLRVDISQSEDEMARLLDVEKITDHTEIVVNIGMLKEGWDVTNVYVIVPLRAMASVTLATQTIGRGLRLPYGQRVGVEEVDTLDVLAFGRETVQEVIEEAKRVGLNVRGNSSNVGELIKHSVDPSRELKIQLPAISLKQDRPDLRNWSPQRHVEIALSQTASVTRVVAETGEASILGESLSIEVTNPPKRLSQLLCREISEVEGQELEVTRIFREYLEDGGCSDVVRQGKALHKYGRQIYDDVKTQIEVVITRAAAEYEHETDEFEEFVFEKATHAIPAQNGIIHKDNALMPQDKNKVVNGWEKSLYSDNKFDTVDELTVAVILDTTPAITWVRNPIRKFSINTQAGRHYPDFIVVGENNCILLEVKNSQELNDVNSEAHLKCKAATRWCELASEISENKFEYWAVPHDRVNECSNISDLKTKRYIFPRD